MTHLYRVLNERDVEEIVQDVRQELNRASKFLEKIEEGERTLSRKIFDLEFHLVSPLYYRLQRHLIDWCDREDHPHLSDLEITKRADREGKKFNEVVGEWTKK